MHNFIDPGKKKKHALAMFDNELVGIELITDGHEFDSQDTVTVEMPDRAWGVVKSVIETARGGERAVAYRTAFALPVEYVSPTTWKHGKKVVHQYNIWQALTKKEQSTFVKGLTYRGAAKTSTEVNQILKARCKKYVSKAPPQYTLGDLIDATGLGLFCLGRIDKVGRTLA